MPGIDETRTFVPLKIAVLTVSDTRSLAEDKSGATLVERIEKAGHTVADRGDPERDLLRRIGRRRLVILRSGAVSLAD